jgi:hypothetical protein
MLSHGEAREELVERSVGDDAITSWSGSIGEPRTCNDVEAHAPG